MKRWMISMLLALGLLMVMVLGLTGIASADIFVSSHSPGCGRGILNILNCVKLEDVLQVLLFF